MSAPIRKTGGATGSSISDFFPFNSLASVVPGVTSETRTRVAGMPYSCRSS